MRMQSLVIGCAVLGCMAASAVADTAPTAELRDFLVMDADTVDAIRAAYEDRDIIHNRLVATQAIGVSAEQAGGNAFYLDMARVTIEVLAENGHNVSVLVEDYASEYDRHLAAN